MMPSLFPTASDVFIDVLSFFNRTQLEQYALVNKQFNKTINSHLNKQPYRLLYRVDIHTTKVGLVLSYDTNKCLRYLHYEKKGAPTAILPYLAAQCIRPENLTLWISPIEFSTSREDSVPELIDMVEQLAHVWKNSSTVAINSCLYLEEQVQVIEDLLFGIQFSSKNLMIGKKEFGSKMCLEFSGSYSMLLFRNSDIFSCLFGWDQIELSGLEDCQCIDGLARYLAWTPVGNYYPRQQYIHTAFCFSESLDDEEKYKNQQLYKHFVRTVEKDFMSSESVFTYTLHIDCFFGHEEMFVEIMEPFQSKKLTNLITSECLQINFDEDEIITIKRYCAHDYNVQ